MTALKECKKELAGLIDKTNSHPIMIRLAWHDAGEGDLGQQVFSHLAWSRPNPIEHASRRLLRHTGPAARSVLFFLTAVEVLMSKVLFVSHTLRNHNFTVSSLSPRVLFCAGFVCGTYYKKSRVLA